MNPGFYQFVYSGLYFVGWGTLALINGELAQTKNRSALNWFLLSLLLGPIATLILLFLDKKAQKQIKGRGTNAHFL